MPQYVLLMRALDAGATKMLVGGSEGIRRQADAIEDLGGTVIAQHVVLGDHDLVLHVDYPDEAAVLATQLAAEAGGMYVNALRICTDSEVDAAFSRFPGLAEFRSKLVEAAVVSESTDAAATDPQSS